VSTTEPSVEVKFNIYRLLTRLPIWALVELGIVQVPQTASLTEAQAGRLIEQLMNSSMYSQPWPYYGKTGMRATGVADLIGLTEAEVFELRHRYRSHEWTRRQAAEAFAAWFRQDEKGRFPPQRLLNPTHNLPTLGKLQKIFQDDEDPGQFKTYGWRGWGYRSCITATWQMGILEPREALRIRNATYRRDAIEHFGIAAVLEGAEVIDDDPVHGRLLRIPLVDAWWETSDRHTQYLEVVNSTPEPDGTYAKYHLRVPPGHTSAKRARAWTFGFVGDWTDFEIGVET